MMTTAFLVTRVRYALPTAFVSMVASIFATRTVGLLNSLTPVMTARATTVGFQTIQRKEGVTTAKSCIGAEGGPTRRSVPRTLEAHQDPAQAMRVFVRVATSEPVHTQTVIV